MRVLTKFALALLLTVGLISVAVLAQEKGVRARGLFVSGKSDAMRILILKTEDNKLVPADPSQTFHKGDQIRVAFESNFDGYVYVVNVTPGGKKRVLFPYAKESNNLIRARQRYELPASAVFIFDEEKGTEILQVIMSREPISLLDTAIKNSNGELGESASSAAAELSGSASKPQRTGLVSENVAAVLPQSGSGAVRTRGIVLAPGKDKDDEGSFVAIPEKNKKEGSGKLSTGEVAVFEIRLQHI